MYKISRLSKKSKALLISSIFVGATVFGGASFTAAQENAQNQEEYTLGDYPELFLDEDEEMDAKLVMGEDSQNMDVESAIVLSEALENETESSPIQENRKNHFGIISSDTDEDDLPDNTELDTEFDEDQNAILIGGPEVNNITEELAEENLTISTENYGEGEAIIQLLPGAFDGEHHAIIVAGYSAEDTQTAAQIIADYEEFEDELAGNQHIRIDTEEEEVMGFEEPQ